MRSSAIQIRPANDADEAAWNDFVAGRADTSLEMDFAWKRVFESSYRKQTTYLLAVRRPQLAGVLPLVWMPSRLAGRRLVSVPFLDRGGILAEDEAVEPLWRAARELMLNHGMELLELRGGSLPPGDSVRSTNRFRLVLPLEESSDAQWQSIGSKVRNQVRKARKRGLATTAAGPEHCSEFYSVWAQNMRDLGSPPHSLGFFQQICTVFGERAKIYLTRDGHQRTVGGAVALRHGDTVTVPWASALRSSRPDCPNHSLYWKILEDTIAVGAGRFDFGRSRRDGGTYHFKHQWGAEPMPLFWNSYDAEGRRVEATHLDADRQAWMAKLWSRLPLALANRFGPKLRCRIPN